ncbi:mitochondrial D-beta-hydroxybutyrate dehydrogenase [Naviculisporaceae sp. PSN 640]
MSADDQAFLDVLSSLPSDIQRYSQEITDYIEKNTHGVADYIDKNVEKIADTIRDVLANSKFVPESLRPPPPPPPAIVAIPTSTLENVQNWISRHKILTGFIVLATGTAIYKTYRTQANLRKTRRAKRSRSGGRTEVVVLAGSPALHLTRALALDLERKGFVVFIVSNSPEDDILINNLSRSDIRPLAIDTSDPLSAGASIERFAHYLQTPQAAVPGAKRHHMSLRAVLLVPSLNYTTSPIATIPPSVFADLFNTHLLNPILTAQSFLPLLTARLSANDESPPKVLVFTPSIISSINPPFHAPEATVCAALSSFTEVLTAELRPLGIPVTHFQLGTFDFAGFSQAQLRHHHLQQQSGLRQGLLCASTGADTLTWPDSARHAYARNFETQCGSAISAGRIRGMRGAQLRDLHNAVFDVIDGSITSSTVRVGLGAGVYGFVGRWVPRSLVAWMMGIRKVDELKTWQYNTPRSAGSVDNDEEADGEKDRTSQDSFIAVEIEQHVADSHVWKEVSQGEGSLSPGLQDYSNRHYP